MSEPNVGKFVKHEDVGVEDGLYGTYDREGKFTPLGNAVNVVEIQQNIETQTVQVMLNFIDRYGIQKTFTFSLSDIASTTKITKLSDFGVQVQSGASANTLVKVLSNQMGETYMRFIYNGLGWMPYKSEIIFRGHNAVGMEASYAGQLLIEPKGKYKAWKEMIDNEVVGNPAREAALSIGFTAPLYGFMHDMLGIESLFAHIWGDSSVGKTTMGLLVLSISCCPDFDKPSLAKSWTDTINAIIRELTNNHGYPVLIDEASQSNKKNLTPFIYTLTGNREKNRLTSDATLNPGGTWHTTVLSTGEYSLLDNAAENMGLRVRLIEFKNVAWTDDAGNADRIREVIKNNYSHAIRRFAKALLEMGRDELADLWHKCVRKCEQALTDDHFNNRIAKKYALILMAAYIVNKKLNIKLDLSGILNFLAENDKSNVEEEPRDLGDKAYDVLLEELEINHHRFELWKESGNKLRQVTKQTHKGVDLIIEPVRQPKGVSWGRIIRCKDRFDENTGKKIAVTHVAVYKKPFHRLMKYRGFESPQNVLQKWKEKGVLISEADRLEIRISGKVPVYRIDISDFQDD
ncbi:MAG: DUF927 domain-containing protein [Oscillospiraceae bacterium]|nr:DUF927 domain-containing protein [Oscillospiraceae bacterium]